MYTVCIGGQQQTAFHSDNVLDAVVGGLEEVDFEVSQQSRNSEHQSVGVRGATTSSALSLSWQEDGLAQRGNVQRSREEDGRPSHSTIPGGGVDPWCLATA